MISRLENQQFDAASVPPMGHPHPLPGHPMHPLDQGRGMKATSSLQSQDKFIDRHSCNGEYSEAMLSPRGNWPLQSCSTPCKVEKRVVEVV